MKTSELQPQAGRQVATATPNNSIPRAVVDPRSQLKRRVLFSLGLLSSYLVYLTIFLALWAVAPFAIAGWTPVTIISGSMSPAINVGDVVVASSHDGQNLGPGSVVVFEDSAGRGFVTHRIVEVNADGSYQTKGDANAQPDSTPLQPDQVVGEGRLLIPYIGLPFKWLSAGEWLNLVLWIGVMGTAIMFSRYAHVDKNDPWARREKGPHGMA